MKICLIAEGSYPYVTGGVSSWINQLLLNMPENEFIIIAINSDGNRRGHYKYTLPSNLVLLHDIFLNEMPTRIRQRNRQVPMSQTEIVIMRNLILGQTQDWPALFKIFREWGKNGVQALDLLMSKHFFDLIRDIYESRYDQLPFAQVYWTLRSMYQLVFNLLLIDYPCADIYHAVSTGYAGIIGACAANIHQADFILTEHGIYTREREEEIIKADWVKGFFKNIWIDYFGILSRCAYTCASQVVTLFDRNREIQCELGCPAAKSIIIHNGVNISIYEPVANAIRERPPRPEIKIGAIIRVVPIKDIRTMLLAFAIVSKKLPQATFYIMGSAEEDPDYYQECIQYMHRIELDRAIFTGNVDIRSSLKDIDLLVLTSISEGQPLAILEGLACTLPFVTTDVGDCRVMINGLNDPFGPAGRVVPIMDAAAIAESIIDLSENHTMRRKMGEAGYQRVKSAYSFDGLINDYREIYNKYTRRIH